MHFDLMLWTAFVFATVTITMTHPSTTKTYYLDQYNQWKLKAPTTANWLYLYSGSDILFNTLEMAGQIISFFNNHVGLWPYKFDVQVKNNDKVIKTYKNNIFGIDNYSFFRVLQDLIQLTNKPLYSVTFTHGKSTEMCVDYLPHIVPDTDEFLKKWYCRNEEHLSIHGMANKIYNNAEKWQVTVHKNQQMRYIYKIGSSSTEADIERDLTRLYQEVN
eukprot:NODE_131_length_16689_cov_0.437914.p3 type:complete len:217 gc:universal NODE_131_length_16689_cov_0.437914:15623-14973(-)